MSNLSCGTHVAEPSANKDCRKLLNQFCRFLPKLKLPISADAKLPLTEGKRDIWSVGLSVKTEKGTYGVSEEPDNADRQQRV